MLRLNILNKVFLFSFIGLFSIFVSSCKDQLDSLKTFRINADASFTIPGSIGVNTPFETPSIPIDISQEFSKNNVNPNLVKDVVLEKLSLTVTNPADKSFSFLKSIHIYIKADGLQEILLASKEGIGTDPGSYIDLNTTQARLDDYIKKEKYSIRSVVVTKETFIGDVDIRSDMTFKMMVNL